MSSTIILDQTEITWGYMRRNSSTSRSTRHGARQSTFVYREVRRFFIENAIYWLDEFRFDGLRFDAVHAICDKTFLPELTREVRGAIGPSRHIHLVVENDDQ